MANTKVTSNVIAGSINLSGNPTTTTQSASDNSTRIATTAYVTGKINDLIGGAPGALDTLNELAAAINDDANAFSTLSTSIAAKLPLAGGTMTGSLGVGVSATSAIAAYMLTGTANHLAAQIENTNTTTSQALVVKGGNDANDYAASFRQRDNTEILKLRGDGAAIFSGTISSGAISATGSANPTSTAHAAAIVTSGNYGGGFATRDTAESGWYQQTNGADWHFYHNRNVSSDTPQSKQVLSFNSSGNATFAGNVSVSGATLTVGAGSGSDPTGDIVINDVAGAKYKIETGSYDLDFMKHDADASAYVSALKIIGANANDGTPDVRVQYQLGVGADPTEALEVNGSIVCSGFTDEEGIFFRSGFTSSNKYNVSILAKDHNGNAADGLSINGYDAITFCTGANSRNEVVRINGGTGTPGFVRIASGNSGDASSRLDIIGNSDNGEDDVTLKITDEDSTSGSVVPQIKFRSGSGDIGRIRVNDVLGMLLSGSGSNEDDLVLKGGKLSNSKPGASSAINASDADVQLAGRHIWKRITPNSTYVTTTASAQFKIAFYRGNDGSNYRTCYYKGVYVIVNAGGNIDWSGHGYATHRSECLINFYSTTSGRASFDLNRGRSYLQNNDSNITVDSVTFSYDSNYLYATFNMITNESGTGWNPFYNVEVIDTDDTVASCSAV